MTYRTTVLTSLNNIALPSWGRCFWQDPIGGAFFLAYVTGNTQLVYSTSIDSGNSWGPPLSISPIANFQTHRNFDTFMDPRGHVHCVFRLGPSGCYQMLGRNGNGTWTKASGETEAQGFVELDDPGVYSPSINASITCLEAEDGIGGMGAVWSDAPCPKIEIAVKASGNDTFTFELGTPFKGIPSGVNPYFILNSLYNPSTNNNGVGPLIFVRRQTDFIGRVFTNPSFIVSEIADFARPGNGTQTNFLCDRNSATAIFTPKGQISQNTGFCSGVGHFDFMSITSSEFSPEIEGHGRMVSHLPASPSATGFHIAPLRIFEGRINDRATITGSIYQKGVGELSPPTQASAIIDIIPRTGVFGPRESGAFVDVTFNNQGDFCFYVQKNTYYGRQGIARYMGRPLPSGGPDTNQGEKAWSWLLVTNPNNHPSGVTYVVEPGADICGGNFGTAFIENFRAIKHASPPNGISPRKMECIAGITTPPAYPSGKLLSVWNIEESAAVQPNHLTAHSMSDLTKSSGNTGGAFSGVIDTFRVDNIHNAFDPELTPQFLANYDRDDRRWIGETTSTVTVSNSSRATLLFYNPILLERIDIVTGNTTDVGQISVSGSFDGNTFFHIGIIPSGTVTSEGIRGLACDTFTIQRAPTALVPAGQQLYNKINPVVTKYIKLEWTTAFGSATRTIGDIRILGGSMYTHGGHGALRHAYTSIQPGYRSYGGFSIRHSLPRTEKFRHTHGQIPPHWLTYGDFKWGIAGSGKFTTDHEVPGYPQSNAYSGRVSSGIFGDLGRSNGFDDGFSLRSEPIGDSNGLGSPLNPVPTGGILSPMFSIAQVTVSVPPNYHIGSARSGDYVKFQMRADMHPNDIFTFTTKMGSVNTTFPVNPVEFDASNQTLVFTTGALRYRGSGLIRDWHEHSYFLAAGDWDLIWKYQRGPSTDPFSYGSIWIDNVYGVSGAPPGSIQGFTQASIPYSTGYINGMVEVLAGESSTIYGFASGGNYFDSIYGYLNSAVDPDALNYINGYLFGNIDSSIHGFVYGTSGITSVTFPTGYILGVVGVPSGSGPSQIYGFVEGDWGRTILGYLAGFSTIGGSGVPNPEATGNQRIFGFVNAIDAAASIYGVLGTNTSAPISNIYGYVDARFGVSGQIIYGYLKQASGDSSIIHGMSQGWDGSPSFFTPPQSMIFGHVAAVESGNTSIYGYTIAQTPYSHILGYMGSEALVASGGGSVGGGPGGGGSSTSNVVSGSNWIWGVLKAVSDEQTIYGYVHAPPGGTSYIHGMAQAGATDDRVYGYLLGKQIASTGIYGFTSGVGYGNSSVYGYTFGVSGIEGSHVYGYGVGAQPANSTILGTLIGMLSGVSSAAACYSHNFPLSPFSSVTIPSSLYNP